jgi:hypothetical protein
LLFTTPGHLISLDSGLFPSPYHGVDRKNIHFFVFPPNNPGLTGFILERDNHQAIMDRGDRPVAGYSTGKKTSYTNSLSNKEESGRHFL